MTEPSKSQVKKAGQTIRRYVRGEASEEQYLHAIEVVAAYRSSVNRPLDKVSNGLKSFLNTLDIDAEVSQRMKRMETIVEKLSGRESTLSLDRMGDIGGCRIVLVDNNIDDLRRIEHWIKFRWGDAVVRERDYIQEPRQSGYRAMHLVVSRDDRLIEIQLRTARMHQWAQMMERISQSVGKNFKQDGVDSPVAVFGQLLSKLHQSEDGMYRISDDEIERLSIVRVPVMDILGVNLGEVGNYGA